MLRSTVGDLYDRCVHFYGNRIALTHGARSVTYAEMGRNAKCVARGLQDLGVRKGENIAFLMANCPEYIFCEYALALIGAVRVPLAVLLSPRDHVYMMNEAQCTTLIYHQSMRQRVAGMIPQLKTVERFICIGDRVEPGSGHLLLSDLIESNPPEPTAVAIDPEDLAAIYFTGGTTGLPKGVMLSHRSWVYTYVAEMLEFGFGWEETFVYPTPLTHAGGALTLPVLLRKGRCVILDHFEDRGTRESHDDVHRPDDDLRPPGPPLPRSVRPLQPAEYPLWGLCHCTRAAETGRRTVRARVYPGVWSDRGSDGSQRPLAGRTRGRKPGAGKADFLVRGAPDLAHRSQAARRRRQRGAAGGARRDRGPLRQHDERLPE